MEGLEQIPGITAEQATAKAGELGMNLGQKINPTEASRLLTAFDINPQEVLSAPNIQGTLTQKAPAMDDLLGIRKQIQAEQGIPELREQYQTAYERLYGAEGIQQRGEEEQVALEGRLAAMPVIAGEQYRARQLTALKESAAGRGLAALGMRLNSALQEAQIIFGIRQGEVEWKRNLKLQYAGAGIKFGDSTSTVEKKIAKYNKKQAEEEAFERLTGKSLSSRPKGMSKKQFKKKELKKINKMEEYNMLLKEIQVAKAQKSSGGGGKPKLTDAIAEMHQQLQTRRGEDRRVDPLDFNQAKTTWIGGGYKASEFDSNFGYMVNTDREEEYDINLE